MADTAADVSASTLANLSCGDPTDPATMMGPLINARQRDKAHKMVTDAIEQGAKLVTGGKRPDDQPVGYYCEPTVLAGVDENDPIAQQEVFGPVLAIIGY